MDVQIAICRPAVKYQVVRGPSKYVLRGKPVVNLGALIEFVVDGVQLRRRLVITVTKIGEEISVASPVGGRLANAKAGDQFVIPMKEPEPDVIVSVVKVLNIESSVAPAVA